MRSHGKENNMLKGNIIVVASNAKLSDGCDYAVQTIRILRSENHVYALLLGEPLTWKEIFVGGFSHIIDYRDRVTYIRPFTIVPGQRFLAG